MKSLSITRKLRQLSMESVHSIDDLATVKYCYDLTDVGVELVISNAAMNALSLLDTITRMQVMEEFGLYASLQSHISMTYNKTVS